ncbi:MAG: hypothetical protein M3436_18980 [Pseudomonadota bacterium]|nr:hypothetical protein [Pseudomonadota bacterium]
MLGQREKQSFAEQGYGVVPQAVPLSLVDAARREVVSRVALEPPPAGHLGPYSYFLAGVPPGPLRALLFGSLALAAYYREHGPDALLRSAPYPRVELSEPRQVVGRAGDLLLAHYLLGHNIGGNITALRREVVYFRLRLEGHRERWRECVQDPLLEFEPVREATDAVQQ